MNGRPARRSGITIPLTVRFAVQTLMFLLIVLAEAAAYYLHLAHGDSIIVEYWVNAVVAAVVYVRILSY